MMNPSAPYPSKAFLTSLPPNPNAYFFPNPDCSYSESQALPVQNLSSSLSSLKTLIHVADQTIQSLSDLRLIRNSQDGKDSDFVQCAFDPHHRVPPRSLFRHSLLCPSASQPHVDPTNLLDSLIYPKTLESPHKLLTEKRFHQTLPDSDSGSGSDLCFSLSDYAGSSSNFFYVDCPGVVSLSNLDEMSKVFTLPRVLAVECANFVGKDDTQMESMQKEFRLLPSDLWALRSEVEEWNDYPSTYSYTVLCAVLGSQMNIKSQLSAWIIANSHRYGVVIDVSMTDHIFLLFRLCFMAISKEALRSLNALEKRNETEYGSVMISWNQSFKCPLLIQVLVWLASQLSVLYGDTNGKFFAINMLRRCILDAASGISLFPTEQTRIESSTLDHESHNLVSSLSDAQNSRLENSIEEFRNTDNRTEEENVTSRLIFVSQVAAAIAALHERFLLEDKIKALRFSHLRSKYQLFSEHNSISQKAHEERKKRCNFRPIIDHDGLPKQQSHNEVDAGKSKTREELLAEERDYKRRRMSYRGKKAKRSTLQVTRDIIEEYMEEIVKAGGIGRFVKGTEEREITSGQPFNHDIPTGDNKHLRGSNHSYGAARHRSSHSKKLPSHNNRASGFSKSKKDHYRCNRSPEDERRSASKDKYDRGHYNRFSDRHSSPSRSHSQKSCQNERENENPPSSLKSWDDSSSRKNGQKLTANNKWMMDTTYNHGSESLMFKSFGDRYNPSESDDQLEDDYSLGSRYVNPEKL